MARRVALACLLLAACAGPPGAAPTRDGGSGECATCHLPEYQAVTDPVHVGHKPTTCGVCHTSEAWSPHVLRHRWPLTGAHHAIREHCFDCHTGSPPVFEDRGDACVDCHRDDYELHTFPAHLRFPTTCERCHTTEAWKPATWFGRPHDGHVRAGDGGSAAPGDGGNAAPGDGGVAAPGDGGSAAHDGAEPARDDAGTEDAGRRRRHRHDAGTPGGGGDGTGVDIVGSASHE